MSYEQIAILSILIVLFILFIWGKWRYDVVSLMALLVAALLGLVQPDSLFSGFGHPATMTLAIVLVVSYGLTKSGAIDGLLRLIEPVSNIPSLHTASLIFIAAFLSMFMNNVGALALLMPIAIRSTIKAGRSPSMVLMPVSFGSILGGLVTLIGTPPNIIIATYRQQMVGQPFNMFDFSPVGGTVAIIGILFMAVIGWRLVKVRKTTNGMELFDIEGYLFEAKVSEKSKVLEMTVAEFEEILNEQNISLLSLIHKREKYTVIPKRHELVENDLLVLEGAQEEIDKLISKYNLILLAAQSAQEEILHSNETSVMELVVTSGSRLERRTVEQVRFKHNLGVNLLAVSRQGKAYRGRLKNFRFKAGDVLLIHGGQDAVESAIPKLNCYPLAERKLDFGKRKLALLALFIFISAIALAVFGVMSIQLSLSLAAVAMVLTKIIPVRELYDGVDWPVIVLLGAMIPIGRSLETTGLTHLIADNMLQLSGSGSAIIALILLLIITMTLSDVLNNAATAILMAPIGYQLSIALDASPDPFLMAVAIGASCAFLTPIGHQNNALVLGPGGYQFGDYWKMGLPLEIIIVIVAIPMILLCWPL